MLLRWPPPLATRRGVILRVMRGVMGGGGPLPEISKIFINFYLLAMSFQ